MTGGGSHFRLHPTADWATLPVPDTGCGLDFYLNGSLVQEATAGTPGDSNSEPYLHRILEPRDVVGLEVFDGAGAPVGRPESCGAVLYWVERLRDSGDPDFTGQVRGRVAGLGETSPSSVRVRIQPLGLETRLDDQGRFDFGRLPPADYSIHARIPEWGTWSTLVELRAETTADVVIEVVRDRSPGGW